MAFDVRFQLVDRRAVAGVLAAIIDDHAAPPPSAFDRVPDSALRWHAVRTAWKGGHDAHAAAVACAFAVSFSAANLPGLVLRNVALTHRPLRMPDELYSLDVPLGSPRTLFDYVTGVRAGVLASIPDRIDHDSLTGAFINNPERAGRSVYEFLSSRGLAPEVRLPAARLLALFRVAERANLAVWEAQDDGTPLLAERVPEATAIFWPGLARVVNDGTPLSAEEWERLDGRWLRTHGDLVDLVTMVDLVNPMDVHRVPAARRALYQAFVAARASSVYVDDDALPRALAWLERTIAVPAFAGDSVLAYAVLESSYINHFDPRRLPAEAFLRATEIATASELEALTRFASRRPHDPELQSALAWVLVRLTPSAAERAPEAQRAELDRLLGAYRTGPIPDVVARAIAERWYELARVAPQLDSFDCSDQDDNTPWVYALDRVLQDAPSLASARMLRKVFGLASPWLGDQKAIDHANTLSPFSLAVIARLPAVRAFLERIEASDDVSDIQETTFAIEVRSKEVELRGLFAAHRTGAIPIERARRIAERWYDLVFDWPESVPEQRFEDDSPSACMVDRLFAPPARAARSPAALANALLAVFDLAPQAPDPLALEATLQRHLPALRALVLDDALDLVTQLRLQEVLQIVRGVDLMGPPAARAEKLVRGWSTLSRGHHPLLKEMVQAGHGRLFVAAFARFLADSPGELDELSSITMRLTGALNVAGLTDPDAFDACLEVVGLAFARQKDPNFLYNAACAHVRRGDIDRAASTLAQAIALDPNQAVDARGDTDFIPHLGHPALAAVLRI